MFRMPRMAFALCLFIFNAAPVFAKDSAAGVEEKHFREMIFSQLVPFNHPWHGSQAADYSRQWAPSFFMNPNAPSEGERLLYVESPDSFRTLVLLEADLTNFHGTRESLAAVAERLGGTVKWAGNNRAHLQLDLALTAEGFAQRPTLMTAIFRSLSEFQTQEDDKAVALAARLFHPARALYAEMGPRLEEMQTDPASGREFMLFDNRPALRRYSAIVDANCEKFLAP